MKWTRSKKNRCCSIHQAKAFHCLLYIPKSGSFKPSIMLCTIQKMNENSAEPNIVLVHGNLPKFFHVGFPVHFRLRVFWTFQRRHSRLPCRLRQHLGMLIVEVCHHGAKINRQRRCPVMHVELPSDFVTVAIEIPPGVEELSNLLPWLAMPSKKFNQKSPQRGQKKGSGQKRMSRRDKNNLLDDNIVFRIALVGNNSMSPSIRFVFSRQK